MKILADELNQLISHMEMRPEPVQRTGCHPPVPEIGDWLATALDAYNMRRNREKCFGGIQLFGEPTWDILLDLFIAQLKNARMQTTSVCIGAHVPQTTALRWIALLERENLVHRYRDKEDSRRVYVELTELALRKMMYLFYDRCLAKAADGRSRPSAPSGSGLGPGEYERARNTILDDTVIQIRNRRRETAVSAGVSVK